MVPDRFSKIFFGACLAGAIAIQTTSANAQAVADSSVKTPAVQEGKVQESKLWLTTGFVSHHFKRDRHYNEENTGLGIEYDFNDAYAFAAGSYRNSVRRTSTYLQFVYTPLQLGPFYIGGAVGLIDGYPKLNGGRFGPALLPVVRYETKLFNYDVGANLMYIPTVVGRVDGALALQFKVRLK